MAATSVLLADVVAVATLLALVVTAWVHPRARVEAAVAVGAVVVVALTGLVPLSDLAEPVARLAPVVAFLVAILVVSHLCDRAGLFAAAGEVLRARARTGPRLLLATVLLAAAVTAVLSLDATVVLLTPVAVAAARASGRSAAPPAWACLRMANSASLLLPVSNLTNLLAVPYLGLGFVGFAARMAPVLVVVVLLEWALLRLLLRRQVVAAQASPPASTPPGASVAAASSTDGRRDVAVASSVVALMLVGFVATSAVGLEPWWSAAAAAALLLARSRRRRTLTWGDAVRAGHPEFALFVLALGMVVAAIDAGFLGDLVASLVPGDASWPALLAVAVLAAVLSAALTNLSAALLLVPLVAPLGETAVLAALLGLNVGAGLVYTGSLANLLWQRTLPPDERPSLAGFHRVSLVVTPPVLLAAVAVLALTS